MSIVHMPIQCEQLFSRRGLGYLWDNRASLDSSTLSYVQALWKNKRPGSLECKQTIEYRLASSKTGKKGYGRYYSRVGVGLEKLEREARGTLCADYYHDIDIVNCHPVLLLQYAKRVYNMDLPRLKEYVKARDEFLAKLSESRDEAKDMVIKVVYGGRTDNYVLIPLGQELHAFSRFLASREEHAELFEDCKSADNRYATFMALLLQTEEVKCMLAMKRSLERLGWSVDVLAYDGVMVRKRDGETLDLSAVAKDILDDTSYEISLVNKPFMRFDMPPAEDKTNECELAYAEMKAKWEVNHFYYKPSNTIVEMGLDGRLFHYGIEHATEAFNMWVLPNDGGKGRAGDEPNLFLKKWRFDTTRRIVDTLVYKRPEDCNPGEATLFCGFNYSKLEPCENPEAVTLFQDIMRCCCGDDEEAYQYVLKWFARIIQDPFNKAGTAVYFLNQGQGSGKDTIGLWFKKLLGNHVAHYKKESDFFEKHDTQKEGAVYCYLEEVGSGASKVHKEELKSFITSDSINVNPKGTKAYSVPNMCNTFATSNKPDPVVAETGDRRYNLNYGSRRLIGKFEFWAEFYRKSKLDQMEPDPSWLYPVGKFLESIDLTGFNVRKMPESEYKNDIMELSEKSEESFIKQWKGEDIKACDLFEQYKAWCVANSRSHIQYENVFGKNLSAYTQYFTKQRREYGVFYSSK